MSPPDLESNQEGAPREGEEQVSFLQRLRRRYGGVDPQISLQRTEEADESGEGRARGSDSTGSSTSKGLWRKLADEPTGAPRYRVLKEIARGGMGTILRVWDDDLRRNLAMKVMLEGPSQLDDSGEVRVDQEKLGRFLEEAQITGQLDHPGIVPVHNLGLAEDGRVYFTMRLVRGRELKEILDLAREGQEGWTLTRAIGLILKVCEAMAFAHSKGVVHRDLKPANVMVGRFGETYVMDWGLARVLGREDTKDIRIQPVEDPSAMSLVRTVRKDESLTNPDSPLVTMDGDVVGTPSYMAPEQAYGKLDQVGPHSDVYSLGSILYYMLTGRAPYVKPGERVSPHTVLNRVLQGPPTAVEKLARDAPSELIAICTKAMAREPERRYASMLEVADELQAYLEGRVVKAYEGGAVAEFRKWVARNRGMAIAIAGLVVLALLSAFGFAVQKQRQIDKSRVQQGLLAVAKTEAEQNLEKARYNANEAQKNLASAEVARKEADEHARQARQQEELARRSGYRANIVSAEFSLRLRDVVEARKRLAACAEDLRPWEWRHLSLRANAALKMIEPRHTTVDAVLLHPDGKRLVLATRAGRLVILDAETGDTQDPRNILQFARGRIGFSDSPRDLDLRRGGEEVVFVGADSHVRTYDLSTGDLLLDLGETGPAHADRVVTAAFSPDGRWLASGDEGGTVLLWSADSGELVRRLLGHGDAVLDLEWSPDGTRLATASKDDTVRLWDTQDGEADFELRGHQGDVTCVAWSRYGDALVSGSEDQTVILWDPASGHLERSLHGHLATVRAVDFHPEENVVLSAGDDKSMMLWNLDTDEHQLVLGHESTVLDATFTQDGLRIVTGGGDGAVGLWDSSGDLSVTRLSHPGEELFSVAQHPDGRRIAVGTQTGLIQVWDTYSQEIVAILRGHTKHVSSLAFNGDGTLLASGSGDKTARIWDVATWHELREVGPLQKWVGAVAWSPDGSWFATGSGSGLVQLWETRSGDLLETMGQGRKWLNALAVDPRGELIAAAGGDKRIALLRRGEEQPVRELEGHGGTGIRKVEFSADGRRLFSAGTIDATARIWDVQTGECTRVLTGHERTVTALAVSPDEERIATGSIGGGLRIWDARSGESVLSLEGYDVEVSGLTWSPDGTRLISVGRDGEALIWESGEVERRSQERQRAAELARRVRPRVEALFAEHFFLADVELHVRAAADLTDDERAAALRMARVQGDDPSALRALTNREVLFPGAEPGVYERAVRRGLAALSLARDEPGLLVTLGAAYYRSGHLDEAVERLQESLERGREARAFPWADEVVARCYLAMARAERGEPREAREALDAARKRYEEEAASVAATPGIDVEAALSEASGTVSRASAGS